MLLIFLPLDRHFGRFAGSLWVRALSATNLMWIHSGGDVDRDSLFRVLSPIGVFESVTILTFIRAALERPLSPSLFLVDHPMDTFIRSWITLETSIAAITILFLMYWTFPSSRTNVPPGPRPLPLIGNIHQIPMDDQEEVYTEWAKQYGTLVLNISARTNRLQAMWCIWEFSGSTLSFSVLWRPLVICWRNAALFILIGLGLYCFPSCAYLPCPTSAMTVPHDSFRQNGLEECIDAFAIVSLVFFPNQKLLSIFQRTSFPKASTIY